MGKPLKRGKSMGGTPKVIIVGHSFVESHYGKQMKGMDVEDSPSGGETALSTIKRFEGHIRAGAAGIIHTGVNDIVIDKYGKEMERAEAAKEKALGALGPMNAKNREPWFRGFRQIQEEYAKDAKGWKTHLGTVRSKMEDACEKALNAGMVHVALVEITPFGSWGGWSQTLGRMAQEYNEMLSDVARKFGGKVSVMKTYGQFGEGGAPEKLDARFAGRDGLHLSPQGYKKMAEVASAHINSLNIQIQPNENKGKGEKSALLASR